MLRTVSAKCAHQTSARVSFASCAIGSRKFFFVAPTCSDGVQNRDETDVDCGGAICPKCIDAKACNAGSDCVSGVCASNVCEGRSAFPDIGLPTNGSFIAPSCIDGARNQDETDVDCGGETCPKCVDSSVCSDASDCVSGVCSSNVCQGELLMPLHGLANSLFFQHPHAMIVSETETRQMSTVEVEHARNVSTPKSALLLRTVSAECAHQTNARVRAQSKTVGLRNSSSAAPTCSDGVRNQDETDVDCGGQKCSRCSIGKACLTAADCSSIQCKSMLCQGKWFATTRTLSKDRLRGFFEKEIQSSNSLYSNFCSVFIDSGE